MCANECVHVCVHVRLYVSRTVYDMELLVWILHNVRYKRSPKSARYVCIQHTILESPIINYTCIAGLLHFC